MQNLIRVENGAETLMKYFGEQYADKTSSEHRVISDIKKKKKRQTYCSFETEPTVTVTVDVKKAKTKSCDHKSS